MHAAHAIMPCAIAEIPEDDSMDADMLSKEPASFSKNAAQ
jgi:hypothetical protein